MTSHRPPATDNSSRICLVLGGVRSGKSNFAEGLVKGMNRPVLYVATGVATDPEMEERIRRHRESRPKDWATLEEPVHLAERLRESLAAADAPATVLLDSLDVWVANVLYQNECEPRAKVESDTLSGLSRSLEVLRQSGASSVLVSSEVGLSLVSSNALGRQFQDLLGLVNQRAAAAADQVYMVVAGIPLGIKGV